ncbi:MAG: hypothetical protein ABIJ36_00930 [Patescibacteria group bacterium]|nr:hypothetical protein [Patescibacteria group bacterium]
MIENTQNISIFARALGLSHNIAQALGVVFGIAMCTLLLMAAGGASQILKHKGSPYMRAGAKITTIHAILGLSLSFLIILLLNLFNKAIK